MSSSVEAGGRLARTIRNQRLAIAGLGGLLVLVVAGGQTEPEHADVREVRVEVPARFPQYTAGGDKIYRISGDGTVEYLVVDFAQGTVEGIPGWAPIHIDHQMSRDRMGNITRAGKR